MNTIQIIKKEFPKANDKELIDLDKIAIIKGYENIKTPEKYLEKYLDNRHPINEATYFKDGREQCSSERNRSFTDLYAILRAKFPRLKIDKFAYILCMYQLDHKKKMHILYCPTVHKIVIKSHPNYSGNIDKKWILVKDKFIKLTEGDNVSDYDWFRQSDKEKFKGDGVTISKITELANAYLSQLKNK
jgi:hypothetical protein